MRFIFQLVFAALGVGCSATTVRSKASGSGQVGVTHGWMALSSRVQVLYLQESVDSAQSRTNWMRFVILRRGQPDWQWAEEANDAAHAADVRAYEEAHLAAMAAHRGFFGSSGPPTYWGETDGSNEHLSVLGQEFALPPRGSALVVLIDRADRAGGTPVLVRSEVIDVQLPPDVRSISGTSGYATLSPRPTTTDIGAFLETLRQEPAIAAFLGETPRSPKWRTP